MTRSSGLWGQHRPRACSTVGTVPQERLSSVLLWQLHRLSLPSPISQMRKLRPVEVAWLPGVTQIESSYLLMLHLDFPVTAGPRRGHSRLQEGREGAARAKRPGDPVKELRSGLGAACLPSPALPPQVHTRLCPALPAGARGSTGERH